MASGANKTLGALDYPAVSRDRNRLRELAGNKRLGLALSDIEKACGLDKIDPELPFVNPLRFSLGSLHHRNDQSYECD